MRIKVGQKVIHLFHYHNTFNFNDNDFASEKAGMVKFTDYVKSRLDITDLKDAARTILLGDFNILSDDVIEILPTPARRSNGRDHISLPDPFSGSRIY